ncbi:MAG TPA: OsmC family protein [Actinomycetota bacterium]|nr:OsmC family protein [Actinomycetota bacterium]
MHNVRLDQIENTRQKSASDPSAAELKASFEGRWHADEGSVQFSGPVKFPKGEVTFEADFPPFLGGDGRAPTPLAYCFYGAMCCYGATFATQAAIAGVEIEDLRIRLNLSVDFRAALGLGEYPPLSKFEFDVEVKSPASDDEIQKVKKLADERCPAIWAMDNKVEYETRAIKA